MNTISQESLPSGVERGNRERGDMVTAFVAKRSSQEEEFRSNVAHWYNKGGNALNEIQGVKNYRMHTFESSIGIEDPAY